jgi:acid phosphatase family membrane protein YuiD
MFWQSLSSYRILICGLLAWWLAQLLKPPIYYLVTRRWNLGLWFSSGGMPSSHSALMVATTLAIGLFTGFNTPDFALAFAVTMVVVYDAAGVRRQAGIHANRINILIQELFSGQPISQEQLKEVLGHTPRQVVVGVFLGLIVPLVIWAVWH